MGPLAVAIAAAMWATDPYFRPELTKQLTASQIVFVESLLIALCFLPFAGRIRGELRHLPLRQWVAMGVIALGAQAFAQIASSDRSSKVDECRGSFSLSRYRKSAPREKISLRASNNSISPPACSGDM